MTEHAVEHRLAGAPRTVGAARDLSYLPPSSPPGNHGHTTAAWTTVVLVLAGATVAAVAVLFALVWLFWLGLGVVVVGVVAGKVLQALGHGQGGASTLARQARTGAH